MTKRSTTYSTYVQNEEPDLVQAQISKNTALVDQTLQGRSRNLLRRLFPPEEDRVIREHDVEQVRLGFEYRRKALQMAVETKLQAVEEMCNHILVTGKSEIRRERQEFFAEQRLQLQEAMNGCAERFNQEVERRLSGLARYSNAHLREREEERLLRSVDEFQDMLDRLAQGFMQIIEEGVSR